MSLSAERKQRTRQRLFESNIEKLNGELTALRKKRQIVAAQGDTSRVAALDTDIVNQERFIERQKQRAVEAGKEII